VALRYGSRGQATERAGCLLVHDVLANPVIEEYRVEFLE
jgi:phosphoribosylformylglycinamidine (FGAM) synthase PurS component